MTRRIVLAGASGLIGRELAAALRHRGDEVHLLVRGEVQGQYEHSWNPSIGEVDATVLSDRVLSGADALISLNGASVGHLPWTKSYKSQLLASRLNSTRALARGPASALPISRSSSLAARTASASACNAGPGAAPETVAT